MSDKSVHISLQFPEHVALLRSDGLTALVEPYLKGSGYILRLFVKVKAVESA